MSSASFRGSVPRIISVASAICVSGCAASLPPPPAPAAIAPRIEDAPDAPPARGSGRVTLDVPRDTAKVERVVETTEILPPAYANMPRTSAIGATFELRKTQLLCTTPCIVDLPYGAHTLVFTSLKDETHTSTATVTVSSRPSVVRHALGKDKPYSSGYLGGWALILMGSGLTMFGATATAIGAAAEASPPNSGNAQSSASPTAFLAIGLVTLGIGIATGATGVVLATTNRPEHGPGSTVEWALAK